MNQKSKNFCFCTLAFNPPYRKMSKDLARDLEKYAPGIRIVIGTDEVKDFKDCPNVISYHQKQQGILHCYNDKRFVFEFALSRFDMAIFIDADTRFNEPIPREIDDFSGIQGVHKNLIGHITKYRPDRLSVVKKVAEKLKINLDDVSYFGESILMVSNQDSQAKIFLENWGKIGRYLELNGIHSGEGITIGIAAFQAGWQPKKSRDWETLNRIAQHIDASTIVKKTAWEKLQRRLGYHYRLNKERLLALKDFDFYYS
ncbi:hypothetical protein [Crocosphaera sp. Alani8]|uniref:hypothetical protein n=1 Tax=Crocosphaera sp. Alani8 TaxID=3038952 RepID=UPI00313AB449